MMSQQAPAATTIKVNASITSTHSTSAASLPFESSPLCAASGHLGTVSNGSASSSGGGGGVGAPRDANRRSYSSVDQLNWQRVDDMDEGKSVPRGAAITDGGGPAGGLVGSSTSKWTPDRVVWSETSTPLARQSSLNPVFQIPTSSPGPEYFAGQPQDGRKTLVVVMVGLPARGKTFLAQKICRLLGWHGFMSVVVNVQVAWKQRLWSEKYCEPGTSVKAKSFSQLYQSGTPEHTLYLDILDAIAEQTRRFFEEEGGVVVFINDDFPSAELRRAAFDRLSPLAHSTIFLEVTGDACGAVFERDVTSSPTSGDAVVVSQQAPANRSFRFLELLKAEDPTEYLPDCVGVAAVSDFSERIRRIEDVYEPLSSTSEYSYIRLRGSCNLEIHQVKGFLCGKIVSFLMSLSLGKVQHPIYFVRHGQSMYNLEDRLGGDPELTEKGHKDAEALLNFVRKLHEDEVSRQETHTLEVWTSQLRRAVQTAQPIEDILGIKCLRWSCLNEIHAGVCENMTYKEVEKVYPMIHKFRGEEKYAFRYPKGESYQDLVQRLEPVIMELENTNRSVVVVAHQAVLRALLSYFGSTSAESSVYVEVPHRTVWRCVYDRQGHVRLDKLALDEVLK